MSVGLVLRRQFPIELAEWRALVSADPLLRIRTEPYFAQNPRTGASITIAVGEADAELEIDSQWLPFLRWRNGQLTTEFQDEFEESTNPIRCKVAQVASALGAAIGTDAGDEEFQW